VADVPVPGEELTPDAGPPVDASPALPAAVQKLLDDQTVAYALDLHGNSNIKEKCPDGGKDENVFDIDPLLAGPPWSRLEPAPAQMELRESSQRQSMQS